MYDQLRDLLLSNADLDQLVSDRINWGSRPQGSRLPAVVLHLVGDSEASTQQGPEGLSISRVQINCHARTFLEAANTASAVKKALNGYRGGIFQGIFLELTRSSREGGTNEAERPFLMQLDFIANWSNTDD